MRRTHGLVALAAAAITLLLAVPAEATSPGRVNGRIAFGAFVAGQPEADIWSVWPNGLGAYEIWLMTAAGGRERQLTTMATRALFPDFAPDGQSVVFDSRRTPSGLPDLFVVGVEGGDPVALTDTPALSERYAAWLHDVTAGTQRQLTSDATRKDQVPDWSPDGSRIAYEADGDYWTMNSDGSDRRVLAPTPGLLQAVPAWQPIAPPRSRS